MSSATVSIEREIKTAIDPLVKQDLEKDILRTRIHGEGVNFENIKTELQTALALFRKLQYVELRVLPEEFLRKLNKNVQSVRDRFNNIREFTVKGGDPERERDNRVNQFHQDYTELLPLLITALQFHAFTTDNLSVEQVAQQMQEVLSDVERLAKNFKDTVDKHTNTVNQTVQEFGMRSYAKIFIDESTEFKKSAKTWFTASMWLLAGAIVFGVILLFISKDFVDKLDVIQFTITKILILTALFYGVTICFKNYKAHKHNEILNKHRHNALLTFEAFTGSKEDQQTKSAVLLAATQTIFGSQNTGYNDGDRSDSELPSKIIEIIKTPTLKT